MGSILEMTSFEVVPPSATTSAELDLDNAVPLKCEGTGTTQDVIGERYSTNR